MGTCVTSFCWESAFSETGSAIGSQRGCGICTVIGRLRRSSFQIKYRSQAPAERDLLADAALAVETAPWPKQDSVSFVSRITGAADQSRLTRAQTISIYLDDLQPDGARFGQLAFDARANLSAADRLNRVAQNAVTSPRLSMNDVSAVERAIKALRENRQIYVAAARQLEKVGEPVDEAQMDAIRDAFKVSIKDLGKTADALADQIERDRSETFAGPEQPE